MIVRFINDVSTRETSFVSPGGNLRPEWWTTLLTGCAQVLWKLFVSTRWSAIETRVFTGKVKQWDASSSSVSTVLIWWKHTQDNGCEGSIPNMARQKATLVFIRNAKWFNTKVILVSRNANGYFFFLALHVIIAGEITSWHNLTQSWTRTHSLFTNNWSKRSPLNFCTGELSFC